MKHLEYLLSVVLALLVLGGAVVWTHASRQDETARLSCRAGVKAPGYNMKGLQVYPRCGAFKRG